MPLFPFAILGGFLLLIVWMQVNLHRQGYRASRRPPSRTVRYPFDPANSATYRGGARVGMRNATVPLVTLTVDHRWAHLSGFAEVWIDREEVLRVRRIRGTMGSGIMFDTADGRLDGVIFWSTDPGRVLHGFGWYRWPVSAEDAAPATTW